MKISKNIIGSRYIILFIIITILISVFSCISTIKQNNDYKNQINKKIAELIGTIQTKYPNINEEEIIEILNNENNQEIGKEILKKYGITDKNVSILELEKLQTKNIIINIIITLATGGLLTIVFVIYLKQRQNSINKLDQYLQKVSKGDYLVNISESSEDEINNLKNSLYKITVMLKEEAENKKKQNEAILSSVSDISHQLKTPLTSIQILLDNIIENPDMDKQTKRKFLIEISKQLQDMNFLILALLKLSKLDAGVVNFDKTQIDLENLITDVIQTLDVLIEVKQIKIEKNIIKKPKIIGDYNWNKEAILNIIKNAIEYTPSGKTVTITLDRNNIYSSIKITDEGEGIKPEDIKNIFNRFYKSENSNENSIGIGLSLSKAIIENQNGHITVDSKLGQGTTFNIKYY